MATTKFSQGSLTPAFSANVVVTKMVYRSGIMNMDVTVDTVLMATERATFPFTQYVYKLLVDPPGIIPQIMTPMAARGPKSNAKHIAYEKSGMKTYWENKPRPNARFLSFQMARKSSTTTVVPIDNEITMMKSNTRTVSGSIPPLTPEEEYRVQREKERMGGREIEASERGICVRGGGERR
jgi:hypothetical protein